MAQALGVTLPCEDFDTFNGLIFGAMATIPEDGATIEVETAGLVIRITGDPKSSSGNCVGLPGRAAEHRKAGT